MHSVEKAGLTVAGLAASSASAVDLSRVQIRVHVLAKLYLALAQHLFLTDHGKRDGLWLPPSVKGKVNHNIAWIKRYLAVLPNPDLHVEVGKFDMAKMVNPEISGKQSQKGC